MLEASPDDATGRRFVRCGVPWLWLIDPPAQTISERSLVGDAWTVVQEVVGGETVALEAFTALELPLGRLWIDPPTRESARFLKDHVVRESRRAQRRTSGVASLRRFESRDDAARGGRLPRSVGIVEA